MVGYSAWNDMLARAGGNCTRGFRMDEKRHEIPKNNAMVAIAAVCGVVSFALLALLVFFAKEQLRDLGPWVLGSMALMGLGLGGFLRNGSILPPPDDK